MSFWDAAVTVIGGVVLTYAVLLVLLALYARRHPETVRMKEALRLLPDLLTLLCRLTADRTLPRGIRVRLVLLLVYLASPIDLVPDFLPVIGYADDAIIVALVLRPVIRKAGNGRLEQHWPGTPAGLVLIQRLASTATTIAKSVLLFRLAARPPKSAEAGWCGRQSGRTAGGGGPVWVSSR